MKKLYVLFVTAIMLMLFAMSASALDSTGTCGDNVKWNFNESTGKLTISGTGDMTDYNLESAFSPFLSCFDIKTVVIENGVTSVGDYAFTFCRGITEITVPDSLASVGVCSFANCTNMKNAPLGKGVKTIGALAFDNCDGLTKITISDNVIFIDEYAFQSCDGLTEVNLGNGIKSLKFAFTDCRKLKKVTFGNKIDTIGSYTFSNCESLENITIPSTVTTIGNSAFSHCESLTEITIPAGVVNIGESAFDECSGLKKITVESGNIDYSNDSEGVLFDKNKTELIKYPEGKTNTTYTMPNGVKTIGDQAFANCQSLTAMTIPAGVESVGNYAFYDCSNIKTISIPNSTEIIGDAAFNDCDGLTAVTLPTGVTTIGNNAFGYCSNLKSVAIPTSVTSIGDGAFANCENLTDVYYAGSEEQWKTVKIGMYNSVLLNANMHYNFKIDDVHVHFYSAKTTPATCDKEGVTTYTCSCGDSHSEKIQKLEHEIITESTNASFSYDGGYRNFCLLCNKTTGEGVYHKVSTVKLNATKYNYNGKVKTPEVFIEDMMGVDLVEGEDYTVEYENGRKAPGKYAVTVTLMGNYEGEKTLYFSILPGKTSKISASQTTDSIKLTWSKASGATGYRVYQYNSKTGKYVKIKTTTATSLTVKKLKAGTTYKFAVKAYTKDGSETLWSASSVTFKTATSPATPAVKVKPGSKQATISWNKVAGATGYVIYMQDSSGDYNKIGSTKSTSYKKKSLKKGKTYSFRVRAYKTVDGKNIYGGYKTVKAKVK